MEDFKIYLEQKDLASVTIKQKIESVTIFLKWINKEETQITKSDILDYLKHLKNKNLQNVTRQKFLIVLNQYFEHLIEENKVIENPCILLKIRGTRKKILYKIYTPAELQQLFNDYYTVYVQNFDNHHIANNKKLHELCIERNALMLNVLINQGISVKELSKIELEDIDLKKMTLRMKGCKTNRKRTLPIKPSQMGMLVYYLNDIRPQLLESQTNETNKLFLPLPQVGSKQTNSQTMRKTIESLIKSIKNIDSNFIGFNQVRASIITQWLKDYGLRKTQYLAGHYKVASTEKYQANNLDELTNDINNLHPF